MLLALVKRRHHTSPSGLASLNADDGVAASPLNPTSPMGSSQDRPPTVLTQVYNFLIVSKTEECEVIHMTELRYSVVRRESFVPSGRLLASYLSTRPEEVRKWFWLLDNRGRDTVHCQT